MRRRITLLFLGPPAIVLGACVALALAVADVALGATQSVRLWWRELRRKP